MKEGKNHSLKPTTLVARIYLMTGNYSSKTEHRLRHLRNSILKNGALHKMNNRDGRSESQVIFVAMQQNKPGCALLGKNVRIINELNVERVAAQR